MTSKQRDESGYYFSAKSRTFYKGDEFYEVMCWIMENVETKSVGTDGCQVARKYSISVKILSEDRKNYSKKLRG